MDLNDAARRILRHHWLLIAVVTLLGLAAPIALDRFSEDTFTASARMILGDTRDVQESNALADTALALATSNGVAEAAVSASGVRRNPDDVVDRVQVTPVGTSGVLELTVTDPDPDGAVALANALTAEVVRAREDAVFGASERLLERLDSASEEERLTVLENLAREIRPQAVGVATAATKVPEAQSTMLALGALFGLILGVALAATIEAFRPTLSGGALPRWLGAPLLGRLRSAPREGADADDPWLGDYVRLAAEGAGVRRLQLVSAGRRVDLAGLARSLDARTGDSCTVEPLDLAAHMPPDAVTGRRPDDVGVVVVCRPVIKVRALARVARYVRLTRSPVVGVITYRGRPRPTEDLDEPEPDSRPTTEPQPLPAPVR